MFKFLRVVPGLALACLLGTAPLNAQEVRATLSGTVTDPTGSPVPGAAIILTNVDRNVATPSEANESGNYVFPFLVPGTYQLSVERAGFKKYSRSNIILEAQDKARADVILELGDISQSVTVDADVSLLQTETASRGQVISNQLISNLPTQGRNPFQIAWSMPGVVKTGDWRYLRSFDIGGTTGFSINGGKRGDNEVLLDGVSNVRGNRTVVGVPSMDAVQEFKVLTNTYDSQYGRTGGGIVTIVTKSGGNAFHGNAFEFFQAEELNANQSELNRAGTPKPPMNINTFGVQASGPVYIPKVFDGRNRLFWLVSYEALRQRSADPGTANFPLMNWRQGDFSDLRNAQGQPITIYDPLTTDAQGNRSPFPGNRIPANRINPVAANVLQYYPAPNASGQINNYVFPSRWVADMDHWNGRLDYRINDRNTAYFRYSQSPFSEYRALVWNGSNAAEPTGNAPLIRIARNYISDWTSILSPSMTFNLRAGLVRWEEQGGNSFGAGFNPTELGFAPGLTSQFTRLQFPRFDFGGNAYQSIGSGNSVLTFSPTDTYSLQPNFNMIVGSHALKFGTEFRRYNDNSNSPGAATGVYNFSRNWTQARAAQGDAASGNEFATFLLGYPSDAYADRNIDTAYRSHYYALFFQDDWKVSSRLTLNMGLRWDYESPMVERYDRQLGEFDFGAASPIDAAAQGIDLRGVPSFSAIDGRPRGSFLPDRNNFQPRFGAAYRIADGWVLRGGYGLYYLGQNEKGSNLGFSQRTSAITSTDGGFHPAVDLNNAFANLPGQQLLTPVGTSAGASSFLGQSLPVQFFNRPLPYSHQFSFDIQRELPGNMLAEIGYVGNLTRRLPIRDTPQNNINVIPAELMGRRNAAGQTDVAWYNEAVPNPMQGLIPNNAGLNGATIPRQQLLRPYPQFSGLSVQNLPIGRQEYHGLQTRITKRFSYGVTFVGSYVFSKTLEQQTALNAQDINLTNIDASKLEKRSATETDVPHKFSFAGVVDLPFGRGKRFGDGMHRAADLALGGWSLNWNLALQSGWAIDYPNARQAVDGDARPTEEQKAQGLLFNTSLWNDPTTGRTVPAIDQFTLRDFPTRFSNVRVPGYKNLDASVSKYFPITESVRAKFSVEMVNATNRPWFSRITSVDVTSPNFGRLDVVQRNLPRFVKLVLNVSW